MKNYLGQAAMWMALVVFFVNIALSLIVKEPKGRLYWIIMAMGPLGVATLSAIHLCLNYTSMKAEQSFFGILGTALAVIWGAPFLWKARKNS